MIELIPEIYSKEKYMHLGCYDCVFCTEGVEETSLHLFWDCPFAQDCWETMIPSRQRGTSAYDDILLVHHKLQNSLQWHDHTRLFEHLESKKWEDVQLSPTVHTDPN